MDVRNIERVERIARYLDVSPGKLEVSAENVSTNVSELVDKFRHRRGSMDQQRDSRSTW